MTTVTGNVNSNNFLTLNPKSCSHYDCSFFMKYSKTSYYNYLVKRLFLDWEDTVSHCWINNIIYTVHSNLAICIRDTKD